MQTSRYSVIKRRITLLEKVMLSGEQNVDTFSFSFDEEWEDLEKVVIFIKDKKNYYVNVINGEVILPSQIYGGGKVSFGIYGYLKDYENETNKTVLATPIYSLFINKSIYSETEEIENLPDRDTWEQYTEIILSLLAQCNVSKNQCEQIVNDLMLFCENAKTEMEQIKEDTEGYKNEAQDILENVQDVKQDIIDMGSARTFATLYLDAKTGKLYMVNAESLGNMGFFIQDGKLYVSMKTEVE